MIVYIPTQSVGTRRSRRTICHWRQDYIDVQQSTENTWSTQWRQLFSRSHAPRGNA